MTRPKPKSQLKPNSRELIYKFVVKAKRELSMIEVRIEHLSISAIETYLRQMANEGTILRRWVRLKPKSRAMWVFRAPETVVNPEYVDADDPSVKPIRKPQAPAKDKKATGADYRKIMKSEPSNYKILRDLPKGSEQVVGELYLADYYDTSSPNYLKDLRA
jgi:hypothetical protein